MHIIIVGCGKVGTSLTEKLSNEGHNVSIIDINNDVVQNVSNTYDVMGCVGNGASYNVQFDAGVEEANLLIAVTGSDELNLLCCLIAKKAGNCSTIARVRNPVYSSEMSFIKEELGLSMTINPEYIAATEIARILRFPAAMKVDAFAQGKLEMLKYKITSESSLVNLPIMNISKKFNNQILIGAVRRGDETFIPNGSFVLLENDIISMIASPASACEFFKRTSFRTDLIQNAMIIGGSKLGFYLATHLLAMGISVKIIEKDINVCNELSDLLPSATIVHGDASEQSLLMDEGITHMDAFISLTNIDEENIFLSLFAKRFSHAKTVTKVNRIDFEEVIATVNLGSVVHPKHLTAEYISRYVSAMQNSLNSKAETSYKLSDNDAEAMEFWVRGQSPLIGVPLKTLTLKDNLLIACIYRNNKVITPSGNDIIQMGDNVVILTTRTDLNSLKDILREE